MSKATTAMDFISMDANELMIWAMQNNHTGLYTALQQHRRHPDLISLDCAIRSALFHYIEVADAMEGKCLDLLHRTPSTFKGAVTS